MNKKGVRRVRSEVNTAQKKTHCQSKRRIQKKTERIEAGDLLLVCAVFPYLCWCAYRPYMIHHDLSVSCLFVSNEIALAHIDKIDKHALHISCVCVCMLG